jgi:Right handed beta helix region/Periplasmic copper-binding protein (NosD)
MIIVDQRGKGDFTTIGGAIAAAAVDDAIMIRPGRYVEHLDIERSLSLIGDIPEPTQAFVDANCVEIVGSVTIDASAVTLRDLTIVLNVTDVKLEEALQLVFEAPDPLSAARLISGNSALLNTDSLKSTVDFFAPIEHQVSAVMVLSGIAQVERCTIVGGRSTGIALCNPQVQLVARHSVIQEGYLGLYLSPYTQAVLEDCTIHRTARLAICADRAHQLTLRHCQVRHNLGTGIYLLNCDQVTIAHSQIHDNRESGLLAKQVNNLQMQHCQVFNHANNGICLRHQSRATIQDCEFYGNVWPSVAVTRAVDLLLQSSHLHEGMTEAIKVSDNCRVDVQSCTIEQHLLAGLYVEQASTVTMQDCQIQDHPAQGIIIQSSSNLVIERSRLQRNGATEKVAAIRNNGNLRVRHCRVNRNYLGLDCDATSSTIVNFSNFGFNQTGAIHHQPGGNISKFLTYESLAKLCHWDHPAWRYVSYGLGVVLAYYAWGQVFRSPAQVRLSPEAARVEQPEPKISAELATPKLDALRPIQIAPLIPATPDPKPDRPTTEPSAAPSPKPSPSPEPTSTTPQPADEPAPSRPIAAEPWRLPIVRSVPKAATLPTTKPIVNPIAQPIPQPTPTIAPSPILDRPSTLVNPSPVISESIPLILYETSDPEPPAAAPPLQP